MKSTRTVSHRKAASPDDKPYISPKARQRPVRVLPADDDAEMLAGHIIPAGDAFATANSFGGSDEKDTFGPDTTDGLGGTDQNETDEAEQPVSRFSAAYDVS